jgi:hypothetical protein
MFTVCAVLAALSVAAPPSGGHVAELYPEVRYTPDPRAPFGYLWTYQLDDRGRLAREVIPYQPREGDLVFFDDMSEWWTFLYKIASTAPPFHVGIVVKKPDGTLAILESGPDDTLHVYVLDLLPRLHTFKGILQVRRCRRALTPDESARLTAFAEKQKGKRYAVWRLLLQGTPFKTRGGPLRRACAHTRFDRHRWLCAEIAVTAAALVGLTDPKKVCGSNTYPLDIIDDSKHDLSASYHAFGYWAPRP